jgi:ketosteroid isomerase-like protein
MKRTPLFVTIAFLAGLALGFVARSVGFNTFLRRDARAADLAAIEKLHQEDIRVTLLQEHKEMLDLWTEDGVIFQLGQPTLLGKKAIQAQYEKVGADYPGFKVLSYVPKFKEVRVFDGWAFEWGDDTEAKFKMSPDSPTVSVRSKGLRVLMRQGDGSWKIALTVGTAEPQ